MFNHATEFSYLFDLLNRNTEHVENCRFNYGDFMENKTFLIRNFIFQEPLSAQSDIKEVRSSAVSPNLKLPPIYPSKASSAPEVVSLPSQNNLNAHSSSSNDTNTRRPSLKDMRLAYENMMVSYFMPQSAKCKFFLLSRISVQ